MTNKSLALSGAKGLTIIELLVTLIISSIVIGAAVALHLTNQRIFAKEEALTEVRNNVRGALDIMISDLREAGYNPTQAFPPAFDPAIRDAQYHLIEFRMDTSKNGVYDIGEEFVYMASNDTLYRGISGVDYSVVAENINYLEFRYRDADGNEFTRPVAAASLENIRAIMILIVGKTSREFTNHYESGTYPDGTPYNDRCFRCWDSTYVRLRNI